MNKMAVISRAPEEEVGCVCDEARGTREGAANRDFHWRAATGAKMGASSSKLLRRERNLLWVIIS